ncbi:MAG: TetR/AcrR family transcriptional regulator [Lachnospiraceae bacterium]|nr:TetR/AcrR family transcriptional regulator [Lachnospiraceae bacterium]
MRDTSRRLKRTKEEIVNALFLLLESNEYEEITIKEIAAGCNITRRTIYRHFKTKDEILHFSFEEYMEKLADHILDHKPERFRELCVLYFTFWEDNIEYLNRLRNAGILYRFGSEFENLVHLMAIRMDHKDQTKDKEYQMYLEKYRFHFAYRTAGFWKVTEIWSGEDDRKTPDQMADIMVEVAAGQ